MCLVQQLAPGALDLIGDVHGDMHALRTLLHRLGYDGNGLHPQRRRLVFVGDLIDRGPESFATVEFVSHLVDQGLAQCVLGNHELNVVLQHRKPDNEWFFDDTTTPKWIQHRCMSFFTDLPLALEREDLAVVHACWHEGMINIARQSSDYVSLYQEYASKIAKELDAHEIVDDVDRKLALQNRNPVKLLTSGPEQRSASIVTIQGKGRWEERQAWWKDYGGRRCVFGHYSLAADDERRNQLRNAFCIDYGVGKRWSEPSASSVGKRWRLAAYRFPEETIVFDDGSPNDRWPNS